MRLRYLVSTVLVLALTACAKEGLVLEKGSNKPLAKAFVVVEWDGVASLGIESRSRCYASEVTQTDANGRYRVSSFSWNFNPAILARSQTVYAYLPNYKGPIQLSDQAPILLEPREEGSSQKFLAISRIPLAAHCEGNWDDKSFIPVRRARAIELQALAQTAEEVRIATGLLEGVRALELGRQSTSLRN